LSVWEQWCSFMENLAFPHWLEKKAGQSLFSDVLKTDNFHSNRKDRFWPAPLRGFVEETKTKLWCQACSQTLFSIIILNSIFLSSIVHIKSWHIANEHHACKNISFLASMFNIVFVWLKRHQRDEELLSTQHFRHSYQQSWQDLGSFCFLNKQTFLERHFFRKNEYTASSL